MRCAWFVAVLSLVLSGSCRDYDELGAASDARQAPAPNGDRPARGGDGPTSPTHGGNAPAAGLSGAMDGGREPTGASGAGGRVIGGEGPPLPGGGHQDGAAGAESSAGNGADPGGHGSSSTDARSLGALADSPSLLAVHRVAPPNVAALPPAYDLSDRLPPPGDQGAQSSAVAWAVATAKSFLAAKQNAWSILSTRYQFSPAWIYSQVAGGVDHGARPSDALQLVVQDGADTSMFFPDRADSYQAVPDAASFKRAARFKATQWGTLTTDALAIKQAIASQQPVIAAFEVFPDFDALDEDNWLYDDASGTSRGRYAAVLVGYDDDRAAFKVMSSWGSEWGDAGFGWLAYRLVEGRAIDLAAYILSEGRIAPPETAPNLYVVENGRLWRVDGNYGDYAGFGKAVWSGSEAITALGGSLYIVQGQWLHRVNPVTGEFVIVGEPLSAGSKLLTKLGDVLYLIDAGVLWRISDFATGYRARASTADLSRATALAAAADSLFVVQDGTLMRVAPDTGETSTIGDAVWYGPISMTAIAGRLYVMNGGAIWVVDDVESGSRRRLGFEDWTNGSVLATHAGALYAMRDRQLWLVEPQHGSSESLGGPNWYVGSIIMAGLP